jgi:hypothetical protein
MMPRGWPISHVGSSRSFGASILIFVAVLLSPQLALAQFTQQGPKLVGSDAVGTPVSQGQSVSLSADGNTAVVGGGADNYNNGFGLGAAWVYTRSGGVWTQQGAKLVANDAVGQAQQGTSVALSADGNTVIVGGFSDNSQTGAAWVYTRNNGVWTQQGSKLVGAGAVGNARQGQSVALSADGSTAIVGGYYDNSAAGAAWVYTRSGGVWTQQGSKLVGSGAVQNAEQGISTALSADGNTAIVGGPSDNSGAGAAWVYTRSGTSWTQQGSKLVGTDAVGNALQGSSVSLSADGSTAIVGGYEDNGNTGAAWVYTRSGGVWTQQGGKLVAVGSLQGLSVALSADGNTAVVGGPGDSSQTGASWVFSRSNGVWTQQGNKLVGTGGVGQLLQGYSVALSADANTAIVGGLNDNGGIGAAWIFVQPVPSLQVTPTTNIAAAGNPGGPFTPSSFPYALSASTGSINYSISGLPNWLTASATSGAATTTATTVTFTVNASANSLAPGSYGPTNITFTNTITGRDTTSVTATLTVNSPPLQVTPTTNIAASGTQGGPFSPTSFNYTLSVVSGSVNYSISNVPNWLTPSSTSGTVSSSSPTTVTFTINNSYANSLTPNTYVNSISFNNTTNGQGSTTRVATLTVNAPPLLQVTPATNMVASGTQGGPFSPPSFQYQLNASAGSVNYSISGLPNWLTASPASGNVSSSGTTVIFTVNANSLAAGTYGPIPITFTNSDTGQGTQTRTATLTVNPPVLQVTPTGNIVAAGNEGALASSSFQYQLSASGSSINHIQFRASRAGLALLQPLAMCPRPVLS